MKKQNLLINTGIFIILFLFCTTGFSQRVDFRNIKINYIHLPLYPLDSKFQTFQSELDLSLPDESMEIEQLVNRYLKIPGYQKTNSNPDLRILVSFGDFKMSEKTLHTDDVYNVNAGKNLTGYLYQIKYEYPVSLKVLSSTGDEIYNQEIILDNKNLDFDFGKWEYSKEDLDRKFESEEQQLLLDKQNKYITQALSAIRDLLNSYYGKGESSERIKIASGKGRKINYSDLDEAVSLMEKAFEETVNLLVDDEIGNGELYKALKIWQTRLVKDEDARQNDGTSLEIYQMLWYNCSVAHLWMKEFNHARETLASAGEVTGDKIPKNHLKMLIDLEEKIVDLEERVKANRKE